MTESEFTRVYKIEKLTDGDSEFTLEPTEEEAKILAERFDLVEIKKLTAHFQLNVKKSKGRIHVEGTLEADIIQTCVVTLESLPASISAPIIRNFITTDSRPDSFTDSAKEAVEIDLSEVDDDDPEPIMSGIIDLGEIAAEQLGLEIDPFPRSPGSEFTDFSSNSADNQESEPDSDNASNPFAILARLKGPSENKQ